MSLSDWQTVKVDDIKALTKNALAMGPFGSNIKSDFFVPDGVPVVRGNNLNADRFNDNDFVFLTEEKADELSSANAFLDDIVFTHRGTLGQVGIIPKNSKYARYVVSQSQMKLTCDKKRVDPYFIFYFFRSPIGQHRLLQNTSTTGVPAISRPLTSLRNIEIPLPPLPEQHAIAHILGTFDDKIELNRRMNATLEAMARAIFKSWFVDFDPVWAKMEGEEPAGMDAETAALFPEVFEEVDGREVPTGWEISTIGFVLELAYGKALKESERLPGQIPIYGSNGQIGWHDEPLVKGPGIIVGRKGNPGTVVWSHTDFFPIDTTFYVTPKMQSMSLPYLYHELMLQSLPSLGSDSAVPGLNRNIAYMNSIVIPPAEVIKRFDTAVMPLFNLIYLNTMQSRTLAALRDTLLPRLISGEIRVPDVMLEAVET